MAASIRALRRQGRLGSAGLLAGREGHRGPDHSLSLRPGRLRRQGRPAHRGDFAAQARAMFQAIKAQVEAGGGTMESIVKINTYLTDIRHRADLGRDPRGVPRQEGARLHAGGGGRARHAGLDDRGRGGRGDLAAVMAELNPYIFRAYDVRGQGRHRHHPRRLQQVGRAYGTLIRRNGGRAVAARAGQPHVVARRSRRRSSTGVLATGRRRRRHRRQHTPLLYFATAHWKLDGGANITGSHNPGLRQRREDGAPRRGAADRGRDPGAARRRSRRRLRARARARCATRDPRDDYFGRDHVRIVAPGAAAARSWSTPATASRASSRPSCCAASAARSSSCTASRTGRFPNHLPDPEDGGERAWTCSAKVRRGRAPTSAWPTTATPTAWASSTSAGAATRPICILALLARDLLDAASGRQDRLRREVARRCWWTTSASTAACRSCGRPATRTSSARCARTGSCSAARSAATCSSPRTSTAWTTASSPRARSSSSWRASPRPGLRALRHPCRTCTPRPS